MLGLTSRESRNSRNIRKLDWNRQWDIITSTGEKYVSMTITGIETTGLYLRPPEVPGYEQICMGETTVVDILAIQLITESPTKAGVPVSWQCHVIILGGQVSVPAGGEAFFSGVLRFCTVLLALQNQRTGMDMG